MGLYLLHHRNTLRPSTAISERYFWALNCYATEVLSSSELVTIGLIFGAEGLYYRCTVGAQTGVLYGYSWALKCYTLGEVLGSPVLCFSTALEPVVAIRYKYSGTFRCCSIDILFGRQLLYCRESVTL